MIQYSIGELIDKLCIANLKIWHLEEEIKRLRDQEEGTEEEILNLCEIVVSLNKLRNDLVDSINEFFEKK